MHLLPIRKNIRMPRLNYVGYQCYFVTLCTFHRQSVFSDSSRCQELLALLDGECASRNFSVLAYCLMPDHLHLLAKGLDPASDLLELLKSFKDKEQSQLRQARRAHFVAKGFLRTYSSSR